MSAALFARSLRPTALSARQAYSHQLVRPQKLQQNVNTSKVFGQTQARLFAHAPPRPAMFVPKHKSVSPFWRAAGVTVVGLGITASIANKQPVYCDTLSTQGRARPVDFDAPPPRSSVNTYQLTFGSVCGFCAGVFIKKGAKALAFLLGGVYVLLQYFGSTSIVKVDWSAAASRFENLFYTKTTDSTTGAVTRSPPNVLGLWRWIVDFLTANFQQRASFVAGFALGLRIG